MSILSPYRHAVNDENLVRWFLAQGADPNASSEMCDITPLPRAVQRAPFEVIQLLFQHGGSTAQGQLLNMASDRTDPDTVAILQFLFDHGDTRINDTYLSTRPELNVRGCINNAAPLHHAARVGNIDSVRWLLRHGANPWQRTVVTIGYGTTPVDSACYDNHMDIVDLLHAAIKESPDIPEPILPKPRTGISIVDETNEAYYESTIRGVRRDINHGNGDRARGPGVMDYSYELMIFTLMENQSKEAHEPSDRKGYSDGCERETRAESSKDPQVKLMIQEQQDKKRQLMMRHESTVPHDSDRDGSTQFNFEKFLEDNSNGIVEWPRLSLAAPGNDSDQKKPSDQNLQPTPQLSSRFWAILGWK